jgi:uncharacterized protein (DUF488 family)
MLTEIVTIGAYGWDEASFFRALSDAGVDAFCDVRQRRGVRGREYAFANSARLQARLAALGIGYVHRLDLAPTPALRAIQGAADAATRTAKRQRAVLSPAYVQAYRTERLAAFDSAAFAAGLGDAARVLALFCVEREPAACHRSLLADRLARDLGLPVRHLLPINPTLGHRSSVQRLRSRSPYHGSAHHSPQIGLRLRCVPPLAG